MQIRDEVVAVRSVGARYLGLSTALAVVLFAVVVAVAVMWGQVDTAVITRVEADGYDPSQLLPHQNAIWLSVQVAVALSALQLAITAIAWRLCVAGQRAAQRSARQDAPA